MAELSIKFLKPEFCRFETAYKDLKVRIKIIDIYDVLQDNIFTAKIITFLGMEYDLTTWTETITDSTTKLTKEYDLNNVVFDLGANVDIDLPLNIGKHTLQVSINGVTASAEFSVVPISVANITAQYLLGVDLVSNTTLQIQQELRKITGVEITEISKETTVGAMEIVWNFTNKTLQWNNGEPVVISDDYTDYILTDYMTTPSVEGGDYIRVTIEDMDLLPAQNEVEVVLVDIKKYQNSEYQYWINNAFRIVAETLIMTDIEPRLYSSDKDLVKLGYKYLNPVMDIPKPYSETSDMSFEFPVNMLQGIIELWGKYKGTGQGDSKIAIDMQRVEFSTDGQVVVRGFPFGMIVAGNTVTLGLPGIWNRTIYSKNNYGDRNKVKNFWNGTVIAGITDPEIQSMALDVISKIAAIDIYVQSGLGRSGGIASRSFSVGGISSSYNTVESAENSLLSSSIIELHRILGSGTATKDQQRIGLISRLIEKIMGGSMIFKY